MQTTQTTSSSTIPQMTTEYMDIRSLGPSETMIFSSEIQNENESFTEHLSFFHHNSLFSIFEPTITATPFLPSTEPFPFLPFQEFIFSSLSPIENDKYLNTSLSKTTQSEIRTIILSRIKAFSSNRSSQSFRNAFILNTPFYISVLSFDDISTQLVPTLSKIIDESLDIKLKFLKVNKEIIDFLNTHGNKGYQLIVNNILTIINELFTQNKNVNDSNQQLQILLYENYIKIAECLNQNDLGNVILTKIISISLDNDNHIMMNNNNSGNKMITGFSYENLKLVIKMIAAISYKLEHNYNEQFILPQLLMLSQNKSEMIKLEICGIIPQFSKYISLDSINTKINHIILQFSEEQFMPQLRIKVLNILYDIMTIYHEKSVYDININNSFYISIYKKLIYDKDTKVQIAAFSILGKFVSILTINEIDNTYINYFTSIIDQYYFNTKDFKVKCDMSLLYPCAYNLPAMIYRYGNTHWKSLKHVYINISTHENIDTAIKLSIISSFNEIANILGNDITEHDLLPVYEVFLQSKNKQIKQKAIDNLIITLKNLPVHIRKKYILLYKDHFGIDGLNKEQLNTFDEHNIVNIDQEVDMNKIQYNSYNDKIKECEIINCFFEVFNNETTYKKILPILILMCLDDYHIVRKKCAKVLGRMLLYLYKSEPNSYSDLIKNVLNSFAYCICFQFRSEFINIAEELLNEQSFYNEYIKEVFVMLSYDKVVNVKVSLAKLCYKVISKQKHIMKNYLLYDKEFLLLCERLLDNESKCVKNEIDRGKVREKVMKKIKDLNINDEGNVNSQKVYYYKFFNDMGFLVDEFDISLPKAVINYENYESKNQFLKKEF